MPARCGQTKSRLCPNGRYPVMAPDRDSMEIRLMARMLGFMMVAAASL